MADPVVTATLDAFVAFVTAVAPIAVAISAPVATVNGEEPLPKRTPVSVVAPDPPDATGKVPVVRAEVDVA